VLASAPPGKPVKQVKSDAGHVRIVPVMKDKSVSHQFSRVEAPGELVRGF
jgi:hypothetical protein